MSDWGDDVAAPAPHSSELSDADQVREAAQIVRHALADPQLREYAAEAIAPIVEATAAVANREDTPPLHFATLTEFVENYLFPVYRRKIDGSSRRWERHWWQSAEATIRLEALWRAWEHLRQDPALGMSVWFRDHADPHMAVLFSNDGPFGAASYDADNTSDGTSPLPYEPPPHGMFTPDEG